MFAHENIVRTVVHTFDQFVLMCFPYFCQA